MSTKWSAKMFYMKACFQVLHYVDKPTTFVSQHISCGVYLLRASIVDRIGKARKCSDSQQVKKESCFDFEAVFL